MSGDYISREAIRNALYDADAITMKGVKILNNFPAADVVEVKHGKWVRVPYDKASGGPRLRCSVCRSRSLYAFNFCPDCGAKMGGGQDE